MITTVLNLVFATVTVLPKLNNLLQVKQGIIAAFMACWCDSDTLTKLVIKVPHQYNVILLQDETDRGKK